MLEENGLRGDSHGPVRTGCLRTIREVPAGYQPRWCREPLETRLGHGEPSNLMRAALIEAGLGLMRGQRDAADERTRCGGVLANGCGRGRGRTLAWRGGLVDVDEGRSVPRCTAWSEWRLGDAMAPTAHTFLMFDGRAAEAMRLYCQVVPGAELLELQPWPAEGPSGVAEGSSPAGAEQGERVYRGRFQVGGQRFMAFDSPVKHEFGFTPAVSIFLEVGSDAEFEACVEGLSVGGQFLMPPGEYGFSRRFAWFSDRFGVSWQVNWV